MKAFLQIKRGIRYNIIDPAQAIKTVLSGVKAYEVLDKA
jgi:hypothetical protein